MIGPIPPARRAQLEALLLDDVSPQLLTLGLLQAHGAERFLACVQDGELVGVCYLGADGIALPAAIKSRAAAVEIGEALRTRAPRCIMGSQLAVAGVLAGFGPRHKAPHTLRLHDVTADDMGPFVTPELRLATPSDLEALIASLQMQQEETLSEAPAPAPALPSPVDAPAASPDAPGALYSAESGLVGHLKEQIAKRHIYLVQSGTQIAFRVEVEAESRHGAHLGAIYTHPAHRARGLASLGLGQLARSMLARLPRLSAFAPKDDPAAQELVRKVGFGPGITWSKSELHPYSVGRR